MKLASALGIRGEKEKPRDSYGSVTVHTASCTLLHGARPIK